MNDRPSEMFSREREQARVDANDKKAAIVSRRKVLVQKTGLDLAQAFAIIGIFMIMAVAGIYFAAAVLMPITLAIVVGLILGLAADRLGRFGISPMLSAAILSSLFAAVLFVTANALIGPLSQLAQDAPAMIDHVIERALPYLERLKWLHITSASFRNTYVSIDSVIENTGGILSTAAAKITPALVQGLIFFAALLLFLGSRLTIRKTLIIAFRNRERRLSAIRTLNAIETALGFYFATAALIYAGLGLITMVVAFAGGLAMPVLWGFFAFLSSFVPFLGVTMMTLALTAAGLLTHDSLLLALAPATAFFCVHMVMENLITPSVMGKRLEINPFAVFVAIIFWTWMWGAIGAMLALPLSLIALTIFNELMPETKTHPKLPD